MFVVCRARKKANNKLKNKKLMTTLQMNFIVVLDTFLLNNMITKILNNKLFNHLNIDFASSSRKLKISCFFF